MLSSLPYLKKNLGAPLQSRKAMLETLFRHLDMVRLSVGALLVLTVVSCTGLIDGGSDGLSPQQRKAAKLWKESALPVLQTSCTGCHDGSRAMVGFLVGTTEAEIHDSVLMYQPPVVSTESPSDSRLLSKGLHDGPELTSDQLSKVLQWIQAEKEAQAHDPTMPQPTLVVPAFAVEVCPAGTAEAACPINHASFDMIADVGALTPGAEISFVAHGLDTGMYMTSIKLSGGTMGANIEHPLFVSVPADKGTPVPDQLDRFFSLKMNEKAGGIDPLGIGSAEFEGFLPANMIEIRFKVVKAFQPDTGKPATGCKALAMFKPVATALQANCTSCHINGGSGQGALDMTGVGAADNPTLMTACNQALTRVDLTTPAKSLIETAPDPASGVTHPLKLPAATFTTFKSSVDAWILAEKAAP